MNCNEIELTNYISGNPAIRFFLHRFMGRIASLLEAIKAKEAYGLDAGCGEGHLLAYLYKRQLVRDMVAIDLDRRKLDYARNHYPYCTYRYGNIQRLDFDDNTFDFVLSTEVFEHLPDPGMALQELQRVAKPEALLVISVPFEPFFHWGNVLRGKYWYRGGRTPDHRHFWHKHEFISFLSSRVQIRSSFSAATFPWLLFYGHFR